MASKNWVAHEEAKDYYTIITRIMAFRFTRTHFWLLGIIFKTTLLFAQSKPSGRLTEIFDQYHEEEAERNTAFNRRSADSQQHQATETEPSSRISRSSFLATEEEEPIDSSKDQVKENNETSIPSALLIRYPELKKPFVVEITSEKGKETISLKDLPDDELAKLPREAMSPEQEASFHEAVSLGRVAKEEERNLEVLNTKLVMATATGLPERDFVPIWNELLEESDEIKSCWNAALSSCQKFYSLNPTSLMSHSLLERATFEYICSEYRVFSLKACKAMSIASAVAINRSEISASTKPVSENSTQNLLWHESKIEWERALDASITLHNLAPARLKTQYAKTIEITELAFKITASLSSTCSTDPSLETAQHFPTTQNQPSQLLPLEEKINYYFKNKNLLTEALTHSSCNRKKEDGTPFNNQRLEFLGDAVLQLVSTDLLFNNYSDSQEGKLTQYRSQLVSATQLDAYAKELELSNHLILIDRNLCRQRSSILGDAFEALVGAIHLDGGFEAAQTFILERIKKNPQKNLSDFDESNPKGSLQEKFGSKASQLIYELVAEEGPDHLKSYTYQVSYGDKVLGVGTGLTKKEAQTAAALSALKALSLSTQNFHSEYSD